MFNSTIPKIIWMLWLQGWDEAPDIVKACRKTWEVHNPDWTIHALNAAELQKYLDTPSLAPPRSSARITAAESLSDRIRLTLLGWWKRIRSAASPETLSDLIRITLLERYGGVWVDSTVYCLKPLDAWLPEMFGSGFFAFAKPGPDRMLSSWFLAASKGNYLVHEWRRRAVEYWSHRTKRHHYFWFHHLFAEAYNSDPHFRVAWDSTPEVSADKPHYFVPYEKLIAPLSSSDLRLLDTPSTPVLKLTHKLPDAQYASDAVLCHLCTRADAAWQRARAVARDKRPSPPRDLPVTRQLGV